MAHTYPHIGEHGRCVCTCDECKTDTEKSTKRYDSGCICESCGCRNYDPEIAEYNERPTYTGPSCNECDTLACMRNQALDMVTHPNMQWPNVFIAGRMFRLEISRALAKHETECPVAAINGRIIPPMLAAKLLMDITDKDSI